MLAYSNQMGALFLIYLGTNKRLVFVTVIVFIVLVVVATIMSVIFDYSKYFAMCQAQGSKRVTIRIEGLRIRYPSTIFSF